MDPVERKEIEQVIQEFGIAVSGAETKPLSDVEEDPAGSRPVVWAIAGSDSGGGAGIQADLKTMNALGVHGCSLLTSLTAQNSMAVSSIEHPSAAFIDEQYESLINDLPPDAIKVGMLGTAAMVQDIGQRIFNLEVFKVVDPVLVSTSGTRLLDQEAEELFKSLLITSAALITPNVPEAEALLDRTIQSPTDVEEAAQGLLGLGAQSVLIKGGHLDTPGFCSDFWTNGVDRIWLTSPKVDTPHTHGTGCVLSSAITSCVALGYHPLDAIVLAKTYLNRALKRGYATGQGKGTLAHEGWPCHAEDLPWLHLQVPTGAPKPTFPDLGPEPIGLYPIVDRAEWVERLIPLGVKTLQIRVKHLEENEQEAEVEKAIAAARGTDCRLFVNDFWELAIKHEAYGVHLGQDDLEYADLDAIAAAGLRLGISTHSYTELARAHAYRPSYIALGTLFKTTSKVMDYPALGLQRFALIRIVSPYPTVAIGGITLENVSQVIRAGANGIAVISDVRDAEDVAKRVGDWLRLLASG